MSNLTFPKPHGITFAFGPSNGIFFEAGHRRYWHNLPDGLLNIFGDRPLLTTKQDQKPEGVKRTVCLSLTPDGGYFLLYENNDGGYIFERSKGSDELHEFLTDDKNDLIRSTMTFAVGSDNETFFARGEDGFYGTLRYRWSGVPAELEKALQFQTAVSHEQPYIWDATIGADGSFVMYAEGGDVNYRSNARIPDELETALEKTEDYEDAVVVLNPYVPGQFFCYLNDGSMRWNIDKFHHLDVQRLAYGFASDRSQKGEVKKM